MEKILREYKKIPSLLKLYLILILLIRIFLLTQPSFKIDMNDWQAWAARLVDVGPLKFYTSNFFADYLPFYYLFLWVIAEIFSFIFGKAAIFSTTFEIYIKIISNIFDILTAYTIFVIINKHSKKWATIGSLLYLINPSIIFNSSVWGQIDAIPTFLLTFSLYQLEEKKNIVRSLSASVLSFLIKPLNIALFPLMLFRIIKNFSAQKILKASGISLLMFFIVTIPFFPNNPIFGPFEHLLKSLNVYPYTSINAYNFWALFGWWKQDSLQVFNLSYHLWGYILFFLIVLTIFIPLFRKKSKSFIKLDYLIYTILSFAFFLFLTRIHERHLFPVFALLIISACIFKSRVLIASYITLAIVNFINLFYSYYYHNVIYNNPMAPKNILFDISSNYQLIFSVLSLIVFSIMLVVYFKNQRLFIKKK
ncbi:MAG: hypothetical protein A3H50_00270 [Candidatus Levybacteria bacterium RIFCSPLOWO2_02_FULL_37_10]|nr:MAG: hypothetical protein A2860_03810 [Candidatus Levybacteria bacterium RIFCSPHIGHO2_01_FULL_37_33]OGH15609.1 MAG: hypothetical protein A3C97_01565 [Candidatus Levybacteria bacterium RIFCSPHIGHO2_02_FULL_37_11]OGH30118.1 MAG: hypothetical protein A3F30_01855 [Candidatus Levybacteria bacterium RIFCSPHIGHO2_12_FULL_37_12]OGH32370.1 MAG: hypothetical protein A2953_01850 [Candidatus Levybacteria bacterium RIFCSPLOWO2_01_FULL_36_54]OGH46308.1 MAG: hypothetical protein A3H50_00270 [Candidatus Lev